MNISRRGALATAAATMASFGAGLPRLAQASDSSLVVGTWGGDYADSRDFKWNNYISRYHSRHLDLMDVMALYQPRASAPLDDIARLCGFPGKLGMDGSKVWQAFQDGRINDIRDYCETDAANTYLVFLRFQLLRGALSPDEYAAEVGRVRDWVAQQAGDHPHWQAFVAAWPAGGRPV